MEDPKEGQNFKIDGKLYKEGKRLPDLAMEIDREGR